MKSMQRRFGALTKRTADEAEVGTILSEFKEVESMLNTLLADLKAYRNSWADIITLQYDCAEACATLYKPVGPLDDPEQRSQPTLTPQGYMQKCLGLQKLYSELRDDLQGAELGLIETKLIRPVETAKDSLKGLKSTLKHRDNAKLDYEKYQKRVEHAGRKETRSAKDEAALAAHEQNSMQARIDYNTADEQVKQTFPPVIDAVVGLLPYILASQIMLQTTLVGQVYTVLDKYTKVHRMANPAPGNGEIVAVWDAEFTGLRKELEQGLSTLSLGKVVHMSMDLPMEKGHTYTGLGLRNKAGAGAGMATSKVGGLLGRKSSAPAVPTKPNLGRRQSSQNSVGAAEQRLAIENGTAYDDEQEEFAPSKPPRPGGSGGYGVPMPMPSPSLNIKNKPRIASAVSGMSSAMISPGHQWPPEKPLPSYEQAAGGVTPPSRYATPLSHIANSAVNSPLYPTDNKIAPAANQADYFTPSTARAAFQRRESQSSVASSAISLAASKKKAPPMPVKRLPSGPQQQQYVTALYDFEGQNEGDLAFGEGDRILVVKRTGSVDDWWEGELGGVRGSFPANYVGL
ncbi:hypothetical protein LTR62_002860 [Meristemomyces frigidus]|uniref:SH3 domain-containing protein n=1 Tax=Meristemomyces frigidus TaxID=1508187 RepID=A0AAN7TQI6_9PEZI|nr:hypothetical protein LTR62_002860 [Meristemomyces frigidus]